MGWGRYFLLGDIGQQLDLSDMRQALEQQDQRDRTQEETIQTLWRENQQLKMAVTGLANLLVQKGVLPQADVEHIAREIDR